MIDILLVEDHRELAQLIVSFLKRDGFQVHHVESGEAALSYLAQTEVRLLLLDIMLPHMDGFTVCKKVREHKAVPILIMSARKDRNDQLNGYELGADDYITKPFSLSVLVLKVNAFFKRYQKSPADELESGDLLFSMSRMSARKGQEDISFTKNEWKMLKLFLEHPKQILSKNQILEQLFDLDGEFADENTVAVNIRRLREKIEPDTAHPQYIRNIRGLGYIWDQNCQTRQRSSV